MIKKIKEFWFGLWFIFLYIPLSAVLNKSDCDRKVKHIVLRCKKNGSSIRFHCDGYIVDIYEPGQNLDGPFEL